MPEEQVLTPGGYRPKSLVHHIEPGHSLRMEGERVKKIHPSGHVVADLGLIAAKAGPHPLMPMNVAIPQSVLKPALGGGWITYAGWTNNSGHPLSSFRTTWVVPPAPATHSGQTIFLFNGIQNSTMIYQPVLQWGPSAAGGGNNWTVASWYADGQAGQAFHSSLVAVNPGQILTGIMTLTGSSGGQFSYSCTFQGIANTTLPIANVQELTWCNETLEAYSVQKCSDYPDCEFTAMRNIAVSCGTTTPSISWTATNAVTDCGQHCVVVSNSASVGEVDLCYEKFAVALTRIAAVTVNSDGRLEVFGLGTNQALWHIWQQVPHAGPWSSWASLGGVLTGEPAAIDNSDGRLEVFARGTDDALWHMWQQAPHAGPWSGWASLGGLITSDPAVACNTDGRLEVFARGTDNALWHIWQQAPHAGPWSGWASLGGGITSDPAVAVNSDGRLEVFVRGTDNALWHIWQQAPHAGPWSNWASLGGSITSDPAVFINSDGRLEIFARGTDNALWHIWQQAPHAGPWSSWASLGGTITSDPVAIDNTDGRLEVFARGTDNALWHIWQQAPHAGPWSGWSSLGGVLINDPAIG
ncbi:MAG: hypothetical protein QOD40_1982 [Alphaproteobacteria bacterium]|nr:hypothetical protein [Alphaproteobacteria bacterium]